MGNAKYLVDLPHLRTKSGKKNHGSLSVAPAIHLLLEPGTTFIILQWDQPFASVSGAPGSANDVDFIFYFGGSPIFSISSFL